jgi:hypothetical protein
LSLNAEPLAAQARAATRRRTSAHVATRLRASPYDAGRFRAVALLVVLAMTVPAHACQKKKPMNGSQPSEVGKLVRSALEAGKTIEFYAPPPADARDAFRRAFEKLARRAYRGETENALELATLFAELGFDLARVDSPRGTFLLVMEQARNARGGGVYVLRSRTAKASPLCLMTPHSFFDLGTERIGLAAFEESSAFALMCGTVHRYTGGRAERKDVFGTDLAHRADNFFYAAFEALLDEIPGLTIVQIHGFTRKHDSRPELDNDVILSLGRPLGEKDTGARDFAGRLRSALPGFAVGIFGEGVENLGGTKNIHAKAIAERGAKATFYHLEMSVELREALLRDANLRSRFAGALP